MNFLANEILNKTLSNEEKERIYSYVGGKSICIYSVIDEMKRKDLDTILNEMLKIEVSKLKYFIKICKKEK